MERINGNADNELKGPINKHEEDPESKNLTKREGKSKRKKYFIIGISINFLFIIVATLVAYFFL